MTKDDIDLAGRKELHEAEKKEHLIQVQDATDWQIVMGTPEGRRVMRHILAMTGYKTDPFDRHGSQMAHNCGKMRVGRMIESRLQDYCPQRYVELLLDNDSVV